MPGQDRMLPASLSSYRGVVTQARLLLGNFRSHESIRRGVIKDAKLIIENQKKKLQKIINLEYKEGNPPDTAYIEADATFITLQKKGKERGGKLEVKLGIGYTGKEDRYSTGKSQRLTKKFVFTGIGKFGKQFMEELSLLVEERLSISKVKNVLFGGDGDSWIISGVDDYFPSATYLLCFYHLFKRLRECLGRRKQEQKVIKNLLLSNQTDKALSKIEQMIRNPYDQKEKDNLTKLYTYISRNRQGITNQVILKDKEIQRTGAIESNVNQVIASRFKKRGVLMSPLSYYLLLKVFMRGQPLTLDIVCKKFKMSNVKD